MSLHRISAIAVLILSLGSAVAFANSQAQQPQKVAQNQENLLSPRRGAQVGLMQALNLTQEQQQRLQNLRQQSKPQMEQRKQALRQAHEELRQMMQGTASADEIRAKHQQVQQLRQQMENLRLENMLAMREVLTPEQRTKFAQLMQQRHQQFRNRGGKSRRGAMGSDSQS